MQLPGVRREQLEVSSGAALGGNASVSLGRKCVSEPWEEMRQQRGLRFWG